MEVRHELSLRKDGGSNTAPSPRIHSCWLLCCQEVFQRKLIEEAGKMCDVSYSFPRLPSALECTELEGVQGELGKGE